MYVFLSKFPKKGKQRLYSLNKIYPLNDNTNTQKQKREILGEEKLIETIT